MLTLHAYDVPLVYGSNTVSLRPSLRAATQLEQLHTGGFPELLQKVQQFDTVTIKAVILASATDQNAAHSLITTITDKPLHKISNASLAPIFRLITALMTPATKQDEAAKSTGTPMQWAELYADLFKIATGWLGWTPEQAWAATLIEITEAFDGHVAKLKAIHGADDDATDTTHNDADRQANIDAGLDPDFDRRALQSLKQSIKG